MKKIINVFVLLLSVNLYAQIPEFELKNSWISSPSGSGSTGSIGCAVDMNGDFLDDVVMIQGSNLIIHYQTADTIFADSVYSIGLSTQPEWSICAGDIDGNGYNDLLMGGGNNASFIMANSDGSHYSEDYHSEYIFCQRSTFSDIDNDGNLDAFICHDVDQSHPYRNDGFGQLTLDTTLIETLDLPGNYAAIWTDYDNDRDVDLYITKCRGGSSPGDPERTNLLYQNDGFGNYTEVGIAANMDDNSQSWATVFEDFDNDGDMDAFIVNHDFTNRFMINNGDGTFTDTINSTGIDPYDLGAWENIGADFNNDGYMDILSELQNELYLNNGDLTFTGHPLQFDEGGIGDFNNDGSLDVISFNDLWINKGNLNNWLKVVTIGTQSNLNGIGARIEIYGDWGIQIREVRAGEGFSPMNTLNTHFGIGTSTEIDSLIVRWPSGIVDVIPNVLINETAQIIEGSSPVSISDEIIEESLVVFPSPANNEIRFKIGVNVVEVGNVVITDVNGKIALRKSLNKGALDISSLPKGAYFVKLNSGQKVFASMLIKD